MKLNYLSNRKTESKDLSLIFLHGNSMSASLFEPQISCNQFSRFQMFAFDLPGHGESPKMFCYSIPLILESLIAQLNGITNFVIVGHSLGGQLAIQLLNKFPNRCKGILVFGTSPLIGDVDLADVYNINKFSLLLLKENLDEVDMDELSNFIYPSKNSWGQEIKKSIRKTDSKFRNDYAISLNSQEYLDELELLRNFDGKKLLIVGSDDPLLRYNYLKKVSNQTDIPLITIEDAGHFPNLDKPEVFNQILINFLKSIDK